MKEGRLGLAAQGLSPLQVAALQHIARGLTERAAGREMGLATSTVRWHLARARSILGAQSLAHAVALAVAAGLVRAEGGTRED